MVHGITEILNEIHSWGWGIEPHAAVILEDRFGIKYAGNFLLKFDGDTFAVPETFSEIEFHSQDVEEIRIRAGEKPLIILKKETPPPTKSHRFYSPDSIRQGGLSPAA